MHIAHADAVLVQIFGEVLGHAFGEDGDQGTKALGGNFTHFTQEIIDLRARWPDNDFRVDEACRADDLLNKHAASLLHFPFAGRGRDMHGLRAHGVPFLEPQRPVIEAGREAETVFGERRLALKVAAIHAADLRHGDVALIGKHQSVIGQIFEQSRRRLARFTACEIARIILDTLAHAGGFQHFEIEQRALLQPLRFEQTARAVEIVEPMLQLFFDAFDRLQQSRARRDIMRIGVDLYGLQIGGLIAGQRIEFNNAFDFVTEHRHTPGAVFIMGRKDFDNVATHAEGAADKITAGTLIL